MAPRFLPPVQLLDRCSSLRTCPCLRHPPHPHHPHPAPPRTQERPEGIVVQFGGQTPLKIATTLENYLNEFKIPTASGACV